MHLVIPNCRARLTKDDIAFVEESVLGHPADDTDALFQDTEMLDALLEQDALYDALMDDPAVCRLSLPLYFYVLVRRQLHHAGVDDRQLADFVASVLVRFCSPEFRLPPYLVDMMLSEQGMSAPEQFEHRSALANHLLVLTGLFPDYLEQRMERRGAPDVAYYSSYARSCYHSASTYVLAREFDVEDIYRKLVDSFEDIRKELYTLRETTLHMDPPADLFGLN